MAQKPSHGESPTGDVEISPVPSAFTDSRAQGTLRWSVEQGKHERELEKLRQAAEAKRRELDEIEKDNASRRQRENVGFYTVLGVVVSGLSVSLIIGVMSANGDTRSWAQGAFTLILGSLLGALAGYFTGKSTR
jgi:hypothetical protein